MIALYFFNQHNEIYLFYKNKISVIFCSVLFKTSKDKTTGIWLELLNLVRIIIIISTDHLFHRSYKKRRCFVIINVTTLRISLRKVIFVEHCIVKNTTHAFCNLYGVYSQGLCQYGRNIEHRTTIGVSIISTNRKWQYLGFHNWIFCKIFQYHKSW